jgi:hypothetical protein
MHRWYRCCFDSNPAWDVRRYLTGTRRWEAWALAWGVSGIRRREGRGGQRRGTGVRRRGAGVRKWLRRTGTQRWRQEPRWIGRQDAQRRRGTASERRRLRRKGTWQRRWETGGTAPVWVGDVRRQRRGGLDKFCANSEQVGRQLGL